MHVLKKLHLVKYLHLFENIIFISPLLTFFVDDLLVGKTPLCKPILQLIHSTAHMLCQ